MLLLLWPLLRFYFYFCYCCRRRRCCFEMETRVDVDFGERREAAEGRGGVNGVVVGSHRGSAEGGREGGGDGGSGGGSGGGGDGTGCLGQTLLQMHNLQCAGDTAVVLGA